SNLGSTQVQAMTLRDGSDQRVVEREDGELQRATRPFARLSVARSWWYVASTFTLLLAALAGAMLAPWWPVRLAASVLGTLMLVRTFILYHDFMHGAILPGSRMARAIFYSYAAVNLTPPRSWRDSHNFHHANIGRIAGSDVGAFPLMTTEMWRGSSRTARLAYRVIRHPLTILGAYLTIFLFSVTLLPLLRRPSRYWDSALALLAHGTVVAALWIFAGFDALFFALLLPMAMAAALGGCLFYVQHSFPGMRILPEEEWTVYRAALVSSSYLRLGPVLRWFTGNIGFHHVHHLNSLIPFSRLPEAMAAIPELQESSVTTLKPRDVAACFRANLWDAASGRMVRYREA
ncbi:MAG TPA: fatty acid desaturase, partial [Thermoanaerobaculia bacterium]|nr:fatty acid desaturase [Thermoanaerobaculia bacterium]